MMTGLDQIKSRQGFNRILFLLFAFSAAGVQGCSQNTTSSEIPMSSTLAADTIASVLDKVDHVDFSFVFRTGEYSYNSTEIKDKSSITVHRECGNNCRRFMADVLVHIKESSPSKCIPGKQNLLIELGDAGVVTYSHSGLQAEFMGSCYLSETSINKLLQRSDFIFF